MNIALGYIALGFLTFWLVPLTILLAVFLTRKLITN